MKNILLAFILICTATASVFAQDNIILKTGEEIKAKVEEVGVTEIKYKKADNATGPLYVISKGQVFMIKYENGSKDVFTTTQPSGDMKSGNCTKGSCTATMSDYDKYRRLARKKTVSGAIMTGLGIHALLGGVALTVGSLSGMDGGNGNTNGGGPMNLGGPVLFGAGLLSGALGTALTIVGAINLSRGMKYKKMARDAKPTLGFTPINNPELDKISRAQNQQKLGSLTFTF